MEGKAKEEEREWVGRNVGEEVREEGELYTGG